MDVYYQQVYEKSMYLTQFVMAAGEKPFILNAVGGL